MPPDFQFTLTIENMPYYKPASSTILIMIIAFFNFIKYNPDILLLAGQI